MPLSRATFRTHSRTAALGFVVAWFLLGGLGHFINPAFFVGMVPPWVPAPELAVMVSGVFELLGAVGLLLPTWRRRAGIGLFLLTLCVTPANVHMWQHPELFPLMPQPWLSLALGARLVVQVFLLYCIWWGAIRPSAGTMAPARASGLQ